MKFKRILITGVLAGAMLALPMTAPAFAEPVFSANSNYVERVDWWHHDYDDAMATGTAATMEIGILWKSVRGIRLRLRSRLWRLRKCATTPEPGA